MPDAPLALSVAIVCKNNQRTIERTLDSVRGLASEIVAIDSGSTDRTIKLLEAAGARVIRSDWLGYVRTKQKALEACGQDWILSLDSDESLEPELTASVRTLLEGQTDSIAGARVNRCVWYRNHPLLHVWQPEWRLRLVRRGAARWTGFDPHDKLEITSAGRVVDLTGDLRHDSFETFAEHFRTQAAHAELMAASLHAAGRRVSALRPLTSCLGAFGKQLIAKGGWRDGRAGWIAAYSSASGALMKNAALLELGLDASSGPSDPPPNEAP